MSWIQKHKTVIDNFGILINITGIIVSIYVTIIAMRADEALKESSQRIELLTHRMDSAIMRIEPVVNRTDSAIGTIGNVLATKMIQQKFPKQQNDNVLVVSQVEKLWKNGYILMNEEKYREAIAQFKEVVKQDKRLEEDAYYNIAVAYAKLSRGDFSDKEKESYKDAMLSYLKKAARLGNQEGQNLLRKYGESW
jgi:tetratricopeptide (TPR) repeat protein